MSVASHSLHLKRKQLQACMAILYFLCHMMCMIGFGFKSGSMFRDACFEKTNAFYLNHFLITILDVRCSSPPQIQNGRIVSTIKEMYLPQEKVHYRCNSRYALLGSSFIKCLKKRWSQAPRCAGIYVQIFTMLK